MKTIILDTNALLRFLLNDIPEQSDQVTQLLKNARIQNITLIVPQIVIFELVFGLLRFYKISKSKVIEILNALFSSEGISFEDRAIFEEALLMYETENLSLVDCFLFAKSKQENTELFTFDKKLKGKTGQS